MKRAGLFAFWEIVMAVGRCETLATRRRDGRATMAGILLATTALVLVPEAKAQTLE